MTPITPAGTRARTGPANATQPGVNGTTGEANEADDATRKDSKFLRPQAKQKMTPAQPKQVPPHMRQQNRPPAPQQRWGSTPYQGGKIPAWSQVKRARAY